METLGRVRNIIHYTSCDENSFEFNDFFLNNGRGGGRRIRVKIELEELSESDVKKIISEKPDRTLVFP